MNKEGPGRFTMIGHDPHSLTLIVPYYRNPNFLTVQMHGWAALPRNILDHLAIIVVDDGSPVEQALPVVTALSHLGLPLRLFRIEVDVRWNWLAARNIGAHHAETERLLLTDIDHIVPKETFDIAIWGVLDPFSIYRFSRIEWHGSPIHPHPNSWLMTRDMYWKIGGYDERLSGHYGTDGDYRKRCAEAAPVKILAACLMRHEHQGDSSTRHYKRKQPEDAGVRGLIRSRRKGWKPKVLSFPYHEEKLCSAS